MTSLFLCSLLPISLLAAHGCPWYPDSMLEKQCSAQLGRNTRSQSSIKKTRPVKIVWKRRSAFQNLSWIASSGWLIELSVMGHHILHDTNQKNPSPSVINLGVGQTIYLTHQKWFRFKISYPQIADFPSSLSYSMNGHHWMYPGMYPAFSDIHKLWCWNHIQYTSWYLMIPHGTSWYLMIPHFPNQNTSNPRIFEKSPVNQTIPSES